MQRWVFVFPGQGSQYVGMCRDFYDSYAEVRTLFKQANEILEMDITRLCFEGPDPVLVQTANVQPAITVANLACLTVLRLHDVLPVAAAGHSLGEYSTLHAAGVLDLETTLRLVKERGRLMQQAAEAEPGAMAAVMNLDGERLREICRQSDAEIANINSPDQIIITGTRAAVQRAMDLSLEAGAKRTIELNVSGAWHSRIMQPARRRFATVVQGCTFRDPRIAVINNIDALPLERGTDAPSKLIDQLCGAVLWSRSVERLVEAGYDHFLEVGPKKVLRGLMRRIDRRIQALNVEDAASLTAFLHAGAGAP